MPNTASFGQMVKAALGGDLVDGVQATAQGGRFALPLERAAVISAENVGQSRERILDGVEWLAGDSDASPNLVPPEYHPDRDDKRKNRFRRGLADVQYAT